MGLDGWLTLGIVLGTVALLVTERFPPAVVVVSAVIVLLLARVIDAKAAFSGFSNGAPVTVAALYVLAGAAERTGALGPVASVALGRGGSRRRDLLRVAVPTAAASAFLNNTPIVAMVAPQVAAWARRRGRSASPYLMPVSFAAILGGVVTLIGTSTNLVVSGLLEQSHRAPIALFELTKVGLPVAIVGVLLMVLLAPVLLPDRTSARDTISEQARDFTVEMVVTSGGPLEGRTVADAGLRDLEGVFLVQVERGGHLIAPVAPTEVLDAGDRLAFAGNVAQILDLQRMRGLESAERPHFEVAGNDQRFFEAVVGVNSPVVGQTLKDLSFRARYGAAVVAIHRAGARVDAKLGRVPLRAGDVLLVLGDESFAERWSDRHDFLVVSQLGEPPPLRASKAPVVALVALGIVVVAGAGLVDILEASLAGALALVALGVLTPSEAKRSVDLDVVVLLAASFGIGEAISSSGLADVLARGLVGGFAGWGDVGTLAGVLLATVVLTELITNNAAAALMFPIGIATAVQAGLNPRAFAIAVAIGASASFLTPIGYQTNTMVYGMGGYRFSDFARLGAPITAAMIVVALVAIPVGWPLR